MVTRNVEQPAYGDSDTLRIFSERRTIFMALTAFSATPDGIPSRLNNFRGHACRDKRFFSINSRAVSEELDCTHVPSNNKQFTLASCCQSSNLPVNLIMDPYIIATGHPAQPSSPAAAYRVRLTVKLYFGPLTYARIPH